MKYTDKDSKKKGLEEYLRMINSEKWQELKETITAFDDNTDPTEEELEAIEELFLLILKHLNKI